MQEVRNGLVQLRLELALFVYLEEFSDDEAADDEDDQRQQKLDARFRAEGQDRRKYRFHKDISFLIRWDG